MKKLFNPIDRRQELTEQLFQEHYCSLQKPVIISSGLKWKALGWTPDYFANNFPNKIIKLNCFDSSYPKNYSDYLATQQSMTLREAVQLICNNPNPNTKYYLMQQSIPENFPELMKDFGKPIWKNKNIDYEINLWFGEAGNNTPLHYDAASNFFVQIYGKKHIRLFAPTDSPYLYPHNEETGNSRNISQISDIDKVNMEMHPKFKRAHPYETILKPGESLFIPAGWWHDIRTMEHAISISFWWQDL